MEQGGCKQSGKVKNHLVRGGVPDAPYVALRDGCGWLLKRASTDVGEGVLTLPLAVRREILVGMGGWYNPRFRKPRPKGGRGRPPLQLDWDGCEICRRAYTYRHQRYDTRWLSLYMRFPSSHGRGVGDAAPYGVVFDLSRPLTPPWLHKTPGGEKGKKDNRLTPQPPSAAAPFCKGSDGGAFTLLPLFTTGSVFGRTPP